MAITTTQSTQLYIAYFGRPADPSGQNFWTQAGSTNTMQQQSNNFATDPAGLRFWSDAITNGILSVGDAAWQIVTNTGPADAAIVAAKVTAATGYTDAVTADTTDSVAYGNSAAFASANTWLDAITTEAQATAALVPATLSASLDAMVVASYNASAETYNLTVNTDTFTATSSNYNIFNASDSGVDSTWTALDSLTGHGGNNTFNIGTSLALSNPAGATVTGIQTINVTEAGNQTVTLNTTAFSGLVDLNVTTLATTAATALTVASTTEVDVISSGGAVTVTGGLSQAVTATGGNVTLSNSVGAINVTETAQGADDISVNGGTTVNVTTSGVIAGGTTIIGATTAATGAVVVNTTTSSVAATVQGLITVNGGTSVTVSQNQANAVNTTTTAGAVTVNGNASTTTVSISDVAAANASATVAGRINSTVAVNDVNYGTTTAGTITSVTASGYTSLNIHDSALTTLSVANGSSNIIIDNSDAVTVPVTTLAVTVNGLTGGTLDDADVYTTLNVTTATANSTLANITTGAVTALNLSGTNVLALNSSAGLGNLATLTVSGSAGLSGTFTQATLTDINASATSGNNTVTMNPTIATYEGGSGVDTVTLSVAATKAINGGAGTNDVLIVNAASFALTNITNFEVLGAGANATGAYSAAGFSSVTAGATAGAITFNNVSAGTDLTFTASRGNATVYTLMTDTSSDVLGLTLTSSGALVGDSLTATTVETVNITVTDTDSTAHVDTLTLVDTALTTLTVSGNSSLTLTNTNTTVTSANASGLTDGSFIWTTGALAGASTITGSLLGGDTINAAAAVAAVTITETAGTNNITGSSTIASTLTGGTGADTITGGAGNDTIVGGGGADQITGGVGADQITVTSTTSDVFYVLGDSGANTSTSIQTAELTSTFDIITGVAAGFQIDLSTLMGTTAGGYDTADLDLSATNLAGAADQVEFARGSYDAASGVFTYAANGADTVVTYDASTAGDASALESIILVGYVTSADTTAALGVITLA